MSYIPVAVAFGSAALSADINQIQENVTHCLREKNTTDLIFARVEKTLSLGDAAGDFTTTINFSTDCVDGDPAFATAPTLIGLSASHNGSVSGFSPIAVRFANLGTGSVQIKGQLLDWSTTGTTWTVTIHFGLVGK